MLCWDHEDSFFYEFAKMLGYKSDEICELLRIRVFHYLYNENEKEFWRSINNLFESDHMNFIELTLISIITK